MVFYRNGFKIFIRINDITEKLLENAVEWRLIELHSMLQCRDIEQEIHLSKWTFDRGTFNRIHTWVYFSGAISAPEQAMRLKQTPNNSF